MALVRTSALSRSQVRRLPFGPLDPHLEHIREAIERLRAAQVPLDDTSLEGHAVMLAVLRDEALRAGKLAAALRVEVARGRLLGFQPTGRS